MNQHVGDALMHILVNATVIRSARKGISVSVAAENVLCSARRDFEIAVDRLPAQAELVVAAQKVSSR